MSDNHTYKAALTSELTTLVSQLQSLGVQNPALPADWITTTEGESTADLNDVADRTEEYDERRAELSQLETRYNNVVRALAKFETGTFGTCEVCGEPIEPARLTANPAARTCIAHLENEATLG